MQQKRSQRIGILTTIWIFVVGGWLVTLGQAQPTGSNYTVDVWTTEQGLPQNSVRALVQTRDGYLWVGTFGGLARFDGVKFTTFDTSNTSALPSSFILALHEDRHGTLWIGTDGRGLVKYAQGRFTRYAEPSEVPVEWINRIWEDEDGNLLLLANNKPLQFKDEGFVKTTANYDHLLHRDRQDELRHLQMAQLLSTANSTAGEMEVRRALKLGLFYCSLEDREGNLWIGTNGAGLITFKKTPVQAYGAAQGLSDDSFTAVVPDGAGGLWLAAKRVFHYQNGKFTVLPQPIEPTSIHQDRDGSLWLGGYGRLKDGKLTRTPPLNNLYGGVFHEDHVGDLWIGGIPGSSAKDPGGLFRVHDGVLTAYRTSEGLLYNSVRTITEDRGGAIWIGIGAGGLSRLKDGQATNYTTAHGLNGHGIRDIHQTPEGTLWLATYGGGLTRFKDGRFVTLTTALGLHDNFLSRILADEQGNFWMSSNRGIYRASVRELNEVADGKRHAVQCVVYGVADGMKSSECNGGSQPAGARTPDGRLWFPTINGVVAIDPKQINPLPPPVVIESILADGNTLAVQDELVIAPGHGRLELHYTGLSFVAPQKVRFKYRLEGYDADWVDAGARRVAYYTGLSPGRYRFRVMASNNDGVWNETGAALAIRLRPHFHQTGLFYFGCAAAAGLLGWTLYRLRIGQLMRRTRELEATVAARTAKVVEQKDLLAGTNAELAQTNAQLQQTNASLGEANLRLDRANADLLTTLDRLRLGVVIADLSGVISFISEEAQRLLGESATAAVGRRWAEVLPLRPADLAQLQALSKIPPAQRAKLPVEMKLSGGKHYWVEIEVQDDPHEARRKIFCFYDVTEIYDLRSLFDEEAQYLGLIGHAPAMQMIYKQINDLAPTNTTVLIEGETGVGKELAARAIHQASPRRNQPFIAVNSASLTESLLASQLFGHRRGAFTGATADQKGLFEEAHKGTIFLDEISEVPLSLQASLLRVLQEREIVRLGESRARPVDVRVLAATNRDLTKAVAEGRFREDLFYRICVARLNMPPLREHREDIPLLASSFLKQAREATGKHTHEISREAMERLLAHDWPGNVRELKSAIEVALINCRGGVIQVNDLQPGLTSAALSAAAPNLVSKQRLRQVLKQTHGNRAAAARLLGVSRTTLYRWLNELEME